MTMSPVFPWSKMMSSKHVSSGKDCPKQRNSGSNYKRTQSSPDLESEKSIEDSLIPEPSVFSDDAALSIASKTCDFLMYLESINQPTSISVLEEQFTEGNSLSSKCFLSITASLNDVKRQLECIKSKSIEEYSEGSGMVVSSDDENDGREESPHDCEVLTEHDFRCKVFHLKSVIFVGSWTNQHALMTRVLDISRSEFENDNYGMVAATPSSVEEMITRVTVEEGGKQSCVVCMEELEVGFEASRMPCSHIFHADCIGTWLKQGHSCPICRYQMPTITD